MKTADFFNTHSVFSLNEAARVLAPTGGRPGTVERLKYHLKAGRLKLVARGVYAVVPSGVPVKGFQPDPFLVAVVVRPNGIFFISQRVGTFGGRAFGLDTVHSLR